MKGRKIYCAALAAIGACILAGASLSASAQGRWESVTSRDENNDICIDFEEVQVLLPASWSGKCQMGVGEDGVSFYQTKSRMLWTQKYGYANGGWMFSVNFTTDSDYLEDPNYMTIGGTADGIYYATFPTDVQGYTEDAAAMQEFSEMANDLSWIKEHFLITADSAWEGLDGEYIFPQSSYEYLTADDLYGLDKDQLQMAINEIYARHHRKFVLPEVQAYFDSMSWYEGYVEADQFDVSVMNAYEGANINLLVEQLGSAQQQENIVVSPANTADAYGMIIESGSSYFRVRQEDGSVIQFWYDEAKLGDMGLAAEDLETGAIASLIYDTDSYEAVSILVW